MARRTRVVDTHPEAEDGPDKECCGGGVRHSWREDGGWRTTLLSRSTEQKGQAYAGIGGYIHSLWVPGPRKSNG